MSKRLDQLFLYGQVARAVTAILALAGLLLTAMVAVLAWLALQADLSPVVVTVLIVDLVAVLVGLVFLGLIYRATRQPYRSALGRVVRDWYADKSRLDNQIDPVGHLLPSATVGHGWADESWAGAVYDQYGVPREKRYGD